jgi:hypothetical protein
MFVGPGRASMPVTGNTAAFRATHISGRVKGKIINFKTELTSTLNNLYILKKNNS